MFNLEQAIADWRRHMAAGGIKSAQVLDELESHLRDDVEEQLRSGTAAERAFGSAVRRMGTAGALKKEFAKSGRPKGELRRGFWRGFYLLSSVIAILIDLWTLVSFELSAAERVAGACGVACLAGYLLSLPFSSWWRGGVVHARLLAALKAMGIIVPLWTLWALLTALRVIDVENGVVPTMVMWSLCAAYGLTGLAFASDGGSRGQHGGNGWLPPTCHGPRPVPPGQPRPPACALPAPRSTAHTPVVQRVLESARDEALGLGHDFIGTEHLLLGVLSVGRGGLAEVFQRSQVSIQAVRAEIRRLISALPAHGATSAPPLTPRARKALRLAGSEADALKHFSIGAEHILLGLLLEGGGVAALALNNLGIRVERMREEVFRAR